MESFRERFANCLKENGHGAGARIRYERIDTFRVRCSADFCLEMLRVLRCSVSNESHLFPILDGECLLAAFRLDEINGWNQCVQQALVAWLNASVGFHGLNTGFERLA